MKHGPSLYRQQAQTACRPASIGREARIVRATSDRRTLRASAPNERLTGADDPTRGQPMTAPSRNPGRIEEPERATVDADRPFADRPAFERGGDRVAPDGQRIVDQRGEFADEQREMERKADLIEATAREQRSHEPSTRFWGSRYAQVGPLLALFAGLFTLAIRTW